MGMSLRQLGRPNEVLPLRARHPFKIDTGRLLNERPPCNRCHAHDHGV